MTLAHATALTNAIVCLGMSGFFVARAWTQTPQAPTREDRFFPLALTALYLTLTCLLWRGHAPHLGPLPSAVAYLGLVPMVLALLALGQWYLYGRWLWRDRFIDAVNRHAQEQRSQRLEADRLQLLVEHGQSCLNRSGGDMRQQYSDTPAANTDMAASSRSERNRTARS